MKKLANVVPRLRLGESSTQRPVEQSLSQSRSCPSPTLAISPGTPKRRQSSASAQTTVLAYEDAMRMSASGSMSPPSTARRQRAGSIIQTNDNARAMMRVLSNRSNVVAPLSDAVAPGAQPPPLLPGDPQPAYPLIDYMCVCGLAQPDQSIAPSVLAYAPLSASIERQLALFCFPDQPPRYCIASQKSALLAEPLSVVRSADNAFMFCLNADSRAPVYIFVLRVWELLEEPPPWMPPGCVQGVSLSSERHLTQRAYCMVSHNPYARVMWELLYNAVRLERLRLLATDTDKRLRYAEKGRRFIKIVETLAGEHYRPGSELTLSSQVCFEHSPIVFQVPNATHSLRVSVAAVCMPALLRAFSPINVVELLCAMLTESHVVVVGTQPGRVSACVMALTAVIAPFSWQCTLYPLVHHDLDDIFGSPCPYLCGRIAHNAILPAGADPVAGGRIVVASVDTNSLSVQGCPLPLLPAGDVLARSLSEAHMWLRRCPGVRVHNDMCEDTYPFADLDDRASLQMFSAIEALSQYTVWLINGIRKLLPNHAYGYDPRQTAESTQHSPSNPLLCAELMKQMAPANIEFMDALFNTQHYQAIAPTFGDMPEPSDDSCEAFANVIL